MKIGFREEIKFSQVRESLFGGDEGFRKFQDALASNPQAGNVIQGTGGARKIRWNDPVRGKGKRSGIRIIYAYFEEAALILLIFAYNKNTDDMTADGKRDVRASVENFKRGF